MSGRPTLCLVTDRHRAAPEARTTAQALTALEGALDAAAAAGVDVIQIREIDLEAATLEAFTARLVTRVAALPVRIVVNDRVDVAIAAGAHGVHLRSSGPDTARVRAVAPPDVLVGRSVHLVSEVGHATGADYLIFGTMRASASKGPGAPTQTPEALAEVAAASPVPVWAIGGITPETAAAMLGAGATGIAAIGAFLDGGCEAAIVRARVEAMRHAVAGHF